MNILVLKEKNFYLLSAEFLKNVPVVHLFKLVSDHGLAEEGVQYKYIAELSVSLYYNSWFKVFVFLCYSFVISGSNFVFFGILFLLIFFFWLWSWIWALFFLPFVLVFVEVGPPSFFFLFPFGLELCPFSLFFLLLCLYVKLSNLFLLFKSL